MKVIYNDWIPFRGYKCINLFGVLFARRGAVITEKTLNHERIHTAQMREMGYIPFYVWYFVEWLIEVFHYDTTSYNHNTFEKEAHANDDDLTYLDSRPAFAWWEYI